MTATTIKVTTELRDRLKAQATSHRRTIGEHLEALLDDEARRERFAALRRAMAEHPADESYRAELLEWQSDAWS